MPKHLTSEQRYEIYLGIKRGWRKNRIAREIGVHPSTVCREIERNATSRGEYGWLQAQSKSDARRHGIQGNHRKPPELWWRIERWIVDNDWSPAQIAGVLRREGVHIVKKFQYLAVVLKESYHGLVKASQLLVWLIASGVVRGAAVEHIAASVS